jgi:hypothetical protein
MKKLSAVLVFTISLMLATIPATAGNLPAIVEVTESMMASSGLDTLVEAGIFGSGVPSTLQFSSFVNPATGSFTYSLLPGQSYLGQSISLTTVGTFDPALNSYTWTTTGLYGATPFSGSGSDAWTGDPTEKGETTETWHGQQYTGSGDVEVDVQGAGSNATSKAKNWTFTGPDGHKFGPFNGDDKWMVDPKHPFEGHWVYSNWVSANLAFPQGLQIHGDGFVPLNGGPGAFDLVLTPGTTPEPSTLLTFGWGFLGLAGFLRKRMIT